MGKRPTDQKKRHKLWEKLPTQRSLSDTDYTPQICEATPQTLKSKWNKPCKAVTEMREEDESKILDFIETEKTLHYTKLVALLSVSMETARRYCVEIASKFPENLRYIRGVLTLTKSITFEDLLPEERIKALQKTIETKEELEKKLKKNHIPHLEKALLEKDQDKMANELFRIKKLLGAQKNE